ncbi:MAG: site-specific integrase [Gemmatimonadetes bacterium]|nr:site-specific integrase [Gemmatimonadota bacterium]
MQGSIVKRPGKAKNGKPVVHYHIVVDVGEKWDAKTQRKKRVQKWEKVPPPNTRKHAQQLLAERVAQLHRDEFFEAEKISFREFKDRWVKNYARGQVASSTLSLYDGLFRNHLLPALGEHQLEQITVEDVQALQAAKLSNGLSPQTGIHILRLLRQMLEHAIDWGYLRRNPTKKVKFPRLRRNEMDFLTPEEVQNLFAQVPETWKAFFITAVTTGMRISELLAMKWKHVDWRNGRYLVTEILTRRRSGVAGGFGDPKTEGSAASVDLTPTCMAVLKQHHQLQSANKLAGGGEYEDLDLIFSTEKGRPLDHKNVVNRQFASALTAAGLRHIRFHDLRHTCAALLIDQREPVKYIQRQLRHTSIKTTMDRYGHLLPERSRQAMEKLDARLFGEPSNQAATPATAS